MWVLCTAQYSCAVQKKRDRPHHWGTLGDPLSFQTHNLVSQVWEAIQSLWKEGLWPQVQIVWELHVTQVTEDLRHAECRRKTLTSLKIKHDVYLNTQGGGRDICAWEAWKSGEGGGRWAPYPQHGHCRYIWWSWVQQQRRGPGWQGTCFRVCSWMCWEMNSRSRCMLSTTAMQLWKYYTCVRLWLSNNRLHLTAFVTGKTGWISAQKWNTDFAPWFVPLVIQTVKPLPEQRETSVVWQYYWFSYFVRITK